MAAPSPITDQRIHTLDFFATGRRIKMPERIFRKDFLAFFCGETPAESYSVYSHQWLNISGGPSHEVELTDDAEKTTVIVPAMYVVNMDPAKIDTDRTTAFSSLLAQFQRIQENQPHLAESYLTKALEDKRSRELVPGSQQEQLNKWQAFYAYFKRTDLWSKMQNSSGGSGKTSIGMSFD